MAEEGIAGWSASGSAGAAPGRSSLHQSDFHEGVAVGPVEPGRRDDDASPVRRLFGELVDAAWSAAEALLDAHKRLAAEQMGEVADAVRRTGQSVDQTEGRIIAQYADRAANRIKTASATMREHRWGEIAADIDDFARRQPTWFVVGALGTGFAIGRLFAAAAERERRNAADRRIGAAAARAATVEVAHVGEEF